MTLYAALTAAGIPTSHHESDLYFPVTPASKAILSTFPLQRGIATTFTNQVEGGKWYDIPFAYTPFWDAKQLSARRLAAGLPADEPTYLSNPCPVCGAPMLGVHYHERGKV